MIHRVAKITQKNFIIFTNSVHYPFIPQGPISFSISSFSTQISFRLFELLIKIYCKNFDRNLNLLHFLGMDEKADINLDKSSYQNMKFLWKIERFMIEMSNGQEMMVKF